MSIMYAEGMNSKIALDEKVPQKYLKGQLLEPVYVHKIHK